MSDEAHTVKLPELIPDIQATTAHGTQIVLPISGEPVQVLEAPVTLTVVAPGTLNTGGGSAVQGDVTANKEFVGRDAVNNDVRYSSAGSSVNFLNPDNAALWQANMKLLQDIADVAFRLDDIPGRLQALEKSLHIVPINVPVTVPVKAEINVPLQSWLLIILIVLVLTFGSYLVGRGW